MPGTCNPGYSGGRDQEDCGSKPAQASIRETLSQKNLSQKIKDLVKWWSIFLACMWPWVLSPVKTTATATTKTNDFCCK
jgi:hypothetical protein